ncbi:MAG: hypothetical protein IJY21_03775 [Clostridia bacterium]|nr:hypothetical protein [Clostridia bacterium]
MKKYKIKGLPTQQNATLKNRIVKTRGRAKWVGVVYLAASFFVLIAACFSMMKSDYVKVGLATVWREFTLSSFKSMSTAVNILPFLLALLYIGMLILLLVMFIRAMWGIGGLFKRKANRKYGFNLNVNAMQGMGKVFSDMFAVVLGVYFVIFALSGSGKPTVFFYVFVLLCLTVHFLCGIRGGKASYFDVDENGQMVERRRLVGRIAPFCRNFVQIVGVFAMMYLFLRTSRIHECIEAMLKKDVWVNHFLKNVVSFASVLLQFVTGISLLVLLKHATGTAEFDMEGTRASGMKNYRVFAFFIFLASGATFFYRELFGEVALRYSELEERTFITISRWTDQTSLLLAGLGLAMFIFEIIMRNYPRARVATNGISAENDGENFGQQADEQTEAQTDKKKGEICGEVVQQAIDFSVADDAPTPSET